MNISFILAMLSLFLLSGAFLIEQNDQPKGVDIAGLLKLASIVRNIDGSGNNLKHSDWGKSYTNILRRTPARYEDGKSSPLLNLPNPRFLSEAVSKLDGNIVVANEFNLTMLFGTWGQFLDHDITLSNEGNTEQVTIPVPRCDDYYDK
jgi:peroxidase